MAAKRAQADEKIALIEPPWKLIIIGANITDDSISKTAREILLYRLESDPHEKLNVAEKQPHLVQQMWKQLQEFRALQPADAVPPYRNRENVFTPMPDWKMPNRAKTSE